MPAGMRRKYGMSELPQNQDSPETPRKSRVSRGLVLRLAVVVFWAATAFLFVKDAFPEWFTNSLNGYKDMFPRDVLVKDSWMKILIKDRHSGYLHTKIDTDDLSVVHRYKIFNELQMTLGLLGTSENISTETTVLLDIMFKLQKFTLRVHSSLSTIQIEGRRKPAGNIFLVKIKAGGAPKIMTVEIPDDVIMYSERVDNLVLKLKPGEEMPIKTLNPLDFKPVTAMVKALPREDITYRGSITNVAAFVVEYLGSTSKSWIDASGNIVRQQLLGDLIVAEACEPQEAINRNAMKAGDMDLLDELAVRSNIPVAAPRNCTLLEIELMGSDLKDRVIELPRQTIREATPLALAMTVRAAKFPAASPAIGVFPPDLTQFTEPSPFIQADDPDIISTARKITGGATNAADAAKAVCDWVYKSIEKRASPGVPSAVEVLRTRKGDCNEHTYLFVALARAAGIPAKVTVGVTYSETYGAFYYHAWPSVFAGEWVEMDPTFGQHAVDATHIALLQGDLGDQLVLAQLIGRLKIEIKKQEPGSK